MEKVCTRGNSLFQRPAEKLKSMYPVNSAKLLKYCYGIFLNRCDRNSVDILTEIPICVGGKTTNSIENASQNKTMIFQQHINGQYYVCLKFQSFTRLTYFWISAVQDCYILHALCINSSFKWVPSSENPDLVKKIDEEELLQNRSMQKSYY